MFASRDSRRGVAGVCDVAFTDRHDGAGRSQCASLGLGGAAGDRHTAEQDTNWAQLARELGVPRLVMMQQVHGRDVHVVGVESGAPDSLPVVGDALVTTAADVALCVRVADCVPVVLADESAGVIGVAHAGRAGVAAGVVGATIDAMRALGAQHLAAWVGPHICGGCYEVPRAMRADVAAVAPASFACTTWGTPALDLGAAVNAQLTERGCEVIDRSRCTRESDDLYSYRRDGHSTGRLAGIIVRRGLDHD